MDLTKLRVFNMFRALLLVTLAVAIGACGREAPFTEPGSISVVSVPAGAQIFLNGADTGEVTPHTFTGLQPSAYRISVTLTGFTSTVPEFELNLEPLDARTVGFEFSQTGLEIFSPIAGAAIFLNGEDTGRVTPSTIVGLDAATYEVSLVFDTYLITPSEFSVDVTAGAIVNVPTETFAMRPQRTVLLEGFANIDCGPCPQLTANLVAFADRPEFSRDRVIYLEFSVSWPNSFDPLFLYNGPENSDRYTNYFVLGAPGLYVDGTKLADALDLPALETSVLAELNVDPQFVIDVSADFTNPTIPVTVDITPHADLDLAGHVLYVALYEEVIDFTERGITPGSNGQVVFHHVFRDRVDVPPEVGMLQKDVKRTFDMDLVRGNWELDNLVVVAFVQRSSDLEVLQAGSFSETAKAGGNQR
ncbi:MAG: hypothetical protein ACI9JE_000271 [Candidatus Krumholzibacteriia bacterium]|jgi:hypothetical protein